MRSRMATTNGFSLWNDHKTSAKIGHFSIHSKFLSIFFNKMMKKGNFSIKD